MPEECILCEGRVSIPQATHVMLNPPGEGVWDGYCCDACYREYVEPVFATARAEEEAEDGGAVAERADASPDPSRTEK
jgi:hypothetical protein